eukprot:Awhi_evm1s12068
MWIKLQYGLNDFLFIAVVYLPVENKENSIRDEILEDVVKAYDALEEKGKVVVLGDFNARIGRRDKLGKNVNPNNNGANMLSWISEHNFVVFNSTDEDRFYTREKNGVCSVIDYIVG